VNFEDELPSPILITSEEFETYETPEPSRSLASISECSAGCAPQIVKNHDNPDVKLGCSFRMPLGARRGAPTSHWYFLFFFFFLTQGAFLWPDGNATQRAASVHTLHMPKPVM